jgi:DNA-binding transcriptional LysR family regulator
LDLHKLRIFAAVAELEHYSRAAEILQLSQPAVSAHVHDLERSLGVELFEKCGRGIRLTAEGRLVQTYARRIVATIGELDEAVADRRGLRTGELRLGASSTIGEYLLPEAVGAFRRHYPGVRLAIEIGNTTRVTDRLRRGDLHLALVGEALDDPDLQFESYGTDEIRLIVPPGHPWAGGQVPVAALTSQPLILRERGSATRDVIEQALARAGVQMAVQLELGGTEAIKGAIVAGLGIAFVSACAVAQELASGRLAVVSVVGLEIRRQFQIARRRGGQFSRLESAFVALLRGKQGSSL